MFLVIFNISIEHLNFNGEHWTSVGVVFPVRICCSVMLKRRLTVVVVSFCLTSRCCRSASRSKMTESNLSLSRTMKHKSIKSDFFQTMISDCFSQYWHDVHCSTSLFFYDICMLCGFYLISSFNVFSIQMCSAAMRCRFFSLFTFIQRYS